MNNKKTNIRLLINTWSKLKYSQISFNDKNINQNNIKQIKDCFNSLKLNDLLMDGLSTEKLDKSIVWYFPVVINSVSPLPTQGACINPLPVNPVAK